MLYGKPQALKPTLYLFAYIINTYYVFYTYIHIITHFKPSFVLYKNLLNIFYLITLLIINDLQ